MERRRLLMAQSSGGGGYTTNGLKLWWDADDFNSGDGTWVDRVAGIVATATSNHNKTSDGAVEFTDNGFTFPFAKTDFSLSSVKDCTIECAFYTTRNNNNIFRAVSANNIDIRLGGWNGICPASTVAGSRNYLAGALRNVKWSIGYSPEQCYANGNELITWGNDWNSGSNNGIGYTGGSTGYQFDGKIWSVRVYDRVLTADELINDANLDNERFNLW